MQGHTPKNGIFGILTRSGYPGLTSQQQLLRQGIEAAVGLGPADSVAYSFTLSSLVRDLASGGASCLLSPSMRLASWMLSLLVTQGLCEAWGSFVLRHQGRQRCP